MVELEPEEALLESIEDEELELPPEALPDTLGELVTELLPEEAFGGQLHGAVALEEPVELSIVADELPLEEDWSDELELVLGFVVEDEVELFTFVSVLTLGLAVTDTSGLDGVAVLELDDVCANAEPYAPITAAAVRLTANFASFMRSSFHQGLRAISRKPCAVQRGAPSG